MRFEKTIALILLTILAFVGTTNRVSAVTVNELVDQYPVVSQANASAVYVNRIRIGISNLLQDGTHRPYPGGMYAEDNNKILFWKGQEVALLAQTIPYLDSSNATNLKTFLSYEVKNYLLNQTYQNWILQGNVNTYLPQVNMGYWQWRGVDLESLYGLWAYAQFTGDWNTISTNWSFITNIINNVNGKDSKKLTGVNSYHRAPNSEIAGRIAYARMAKKLFQTTGNASYQTAYQAQISKLSTSISGLVTPIISLDQFSSQACGFDAATLCNPTTMNDRDTIPHLSQFDVLTPEIARYLQSNFLSQSQQVIHKIEAEIPWWFLGGYNLYRIGTGEGYFQPPVLANQIFQAKALIVNIPVSELEYKLPSASAFASLPYYADALNYHNLLTMIEREETVSWTDSNTVHPTVVILGSSVSPTQTVVQKTGDANNDGEVNGRDYIVWVTHYGEVTSAGQSVGDFNKSGKVDGVDYILWLNNYGR